MIIFYGTRRYSVKRKGIFKVREVIIAVWGGKKREGEREREFSFYTHVLHMASQITGRVSVFLISFILGIGELYICLFNASISFVFVYV